MGKMMVERRMAATVYKKFKVGDAVINSGN